MFPLPAAWVCMEGVPEEKRSPFCLFSLCLSRACLGKMFVFIHKWLKKTVFTHRAANAHAPARTSSKFLLSSFLVRVPSQSWQVIVFTRKWCWSMNGAFRTCDAVIGIRSWSQVTWRMGNGPPRTGSPTDSMTQTMQETLRTFRFTIATIDKVQE